MIVISVVLIYSCIIGLVTKSWKIGLLCIPSLILVYTLFDKLESMFGYKLIILLCVPLALYGIYDVLSEIHSDNKQVKSMKGENYHESK